MLRIAFSVFGLFVMYNNASAQQYSDNNIRRREIYNTSTRIPTKVKAIPTVAKELPPVNLPSVRPAQQPAPKNGTVLATVSVNPQNNRIPVNAPNQNITRTSERISTQTGQDANGRTTTKTTKTVTTVRPDGIKQVSTSYNTRVSSMSSTDKTTAIKKNTAPVATVKNKPSAPVTVTTKTTPATKNTAMPKSVEGAAAFSAAQRTAANTGNDAAYLSAEEKRVLLLVNLARADGAVFCKEYVDKYIRSNPAFQNNVFAQSLYTDLKKVKGLPPLRPSMKLCNSARAHAQDIGQKGMKGHQSSNGMKFDTRVARYVGSYRGLGENISYGTAHNNAMPIVLELLIDNNNKDYGHRRNILSPSFETLGISIQPHTKYGYTCVQDFGAGIE